MSPRGPTRGRVPPSPPAWGTRRPKWPSQASQEESSARWGRSWRDSQCWLPGLAWVSPCNSLPRGPGLSIAGGSVGNGRRADMDSRPTAAWSPGGGGRAVGGRASLQSSVSIPCRVGLSTPHGHVHGPLRLLWTPLSLGTLLAKFYFWDPFKDLHPACKTSLTHIPRV